MATTLATHTIVAFNTATASENKIHDDAVAGALGFGGGLVPGVDVYAYLCHPALELWGERFLSGATASVRFDRPVYDGETIEIRATTEGDTLHAEVHSPTGVVATLDAALDTTPTTPPSPGVAPLPTERPPASPASLVPGTTLGTVDLIANAEDLTAYLADIRDPDSSVAGLGLLHPGTLARQANYALSSNVVLGPWIHVGSVVHHLTPAALDERISVRSTVSADYEHKGHRFVDLDVVLVGPDGQARAWIEHRAIYEPRQVRDLSA